MGAPKPFPLPISFGQTDAVKNSGGFLINWEADAVPPGADARTPVTLRGSPGLAVFSDISEFPVVDGLVVNDACYVCLKNGIYRIFPDGGSYKLGTISLLAKGRASTNGIDLLVADGLRTWAYTFRSDEQFRYDTNAPFTDFAVEKTGEPNYYPASTVTFLDGYLIMDRKNTNQFFNTDPLSLTVGGTNFRSAESSPDNVVGVLADHQVLNIFGRDTIEFHYDSGVGDSPFPRVPGGVLEHGAASPYCFAKVNNNTFVLSNEGTVYAITGYSPRQVSTSAIEDEIKKRDASTATAFCYIDGGHSYYQMTLEQNGPDIPAFTGVYDMSTGLWHQRKDETYSRHRASCYMKAFGKNLVGDFSSGKVYEMSTAYYDNAGDPLVAALESGPFVTAGLQLAIDDIMFEIDVGNGTLAFPNPVAGLEISRDDGKTYGNQRQQSLGRLGVYKKRVHWTSCGASIDPRFRFVISDPVPRNLASRAWVKVR
jgi:hypothetical protein